MTVANNFAVPNSWKTHKYDTTTATVKNTRFLERKKKEEEDRT